jgi:hypothetical protein
MKTLRIPTGLLTMACLILLIACSTPIELTSWKDPNQNKQVNKMVVLALFDKLSTIQPMEESVANYFSSQGVPTVQSLSFMVPFQQYSVDAVQKKMDSLGADGLMILTPKGKDVSIYSQPTYYGFYRGYWGGVAAGSTVSTSTTYNLRANLYTTKGDGLLWTGDIAVTDPNDIGGAMRQIAQKIFADLVQKNIVKAPPQPK